MSEADLTRLAATALNRGFQSGAFSPSEAAEAVLARIEAVDPAINSFITVSPEVARAQARAADERWRAGLPRGPLDGVPVSIKDLLNTAGVRTTFGSHAFADNVPNRDCVAAARLAAAGAVLVGKTTTPEFGHKPFTEAPLFGRTLNPWDLSRTCGGSSGGAAAALAAGLGPLALGTDGGGSIRIPSACCGLVGLKPSLGLVPHDQLPDGFNALAYVGPMSRTVADCAAMLRVLAGAHPADPHSQARPLPDLRLRSLGARPLAGRRIKVRAYLGNSQIAGDVERALRDAEAALAGLGATTVADETPIENTIAVWGPLTFSAWASRFGQHVDRHGEKISASLRRWIEQGRAVRGTEVQAALALRTAIFRTVQTWFADADFVLTPTLSRTALAADHDPFDAIEIGGESVGEIRAAWYPYTHPFNLTGHPAISLPAGFGDDGLPLAVQLVARWWADGELLRAAAAFEAERPWAQHWPALAV